MFKRFGIPALVMGTLLSLAPMTASARDRDDYRGGYGYSRGGDYGHERHEREERREHSYYRGGGYYGGGYATPYAYSAPIVPYAYGNGYYDDGYVSPRVSGYYDRWGNFHPYRPYVRPGISIGFGFGR